MTKDKPTFEDFLKDLPLYPEVVRLKSEELADNIMRTNRFLKKEK